MKIIIEMGNVLTKFIGIKKQTSILLQESLAYTSQEFSGREEFTTLFQAEKNYTYTGLVPTAIQILKKKGIEYEIKDSRKKPEKNANFAISQNFIARDYQKEIIDNATSREVIQAATGAGKTFIMASLIAKFCVKPVVVIVPKVSLAEQIKDEFERFLSVEVGIIGGGKNKICDITICTPMSAPLELLRSAKAIFYDEAHNLAATTIFLTSIEARDAYYRIGVSATPWRENGDDLLIEAALSKINPKMSISASKLIEKKKLVPCKINFINFNQNFQWSGSYHQIYDDAIANNIERNNLIINITRDQAIHHNKTILILIKKIDHGDYILNQLNQKITQQKKYIKVIGEDGHENEIEVYNVEFVSGRTSSEKRRAVFESVKMGFTKILIGSTIADEGLDLPKLDCLILAGSGKSSTRAFQRIGRVLRLCEGKSEAVVFDIMDSTNIFRNHAKIRKALYETEPLWEIKSYNDYLQIS